MKVEFARITLRYFSGICLEMNASDLLCGSRGFEIYKHYGIGGSILNRVIILALGNVIHD
jgi:hypothetical protein